MLNDKFLQRLKSQYQREADHSSARGAAEQIGELDRFDNMIEHWIDPWELVRHLISALDSKEGS